MGIFDSFTGAPAKKAAKKSTALWNTTLDDLSSYNDWTGDNAARDLNFGRGEALRALTGYGSEAQDYLGRGLGMARGDVRGNSDQALRYLYGAMDQYQPYKEQGGAASTMLANALGLNGADGGASARAAFETASPYLSIANDRAAEAISRSAAARGMGMSGNTLASIADRTSNNMRSFYNDWLGALQGQQGMGMQAAQAVSGLAGQQAGIAQNAGNTLANLASGWGNNSANLRSGMGNNIAGLNERGGSRLADLWGQRADRMNSLRLAHTNAISNNWKDSANAQMQGNANAWGAGMGLLNTAAKAFSGGMF